MSSDAMSGARKKADIEARWEAVVQFDARASNVKSASTY
jgi:hypothetical protein